MDGGIVADFSPISPHPPTWHCIHCSQCSHEASSNNKCEITRLHMEPALPVHTGWKPPLRAPFFSACIRSSRPPPPRQAIAGSWLRCHVKIGFVLGACCCDVAIVIWCAPLMQSRQAQSSAAFFGACLLKIEMVHAEYIIDNTSHAKTCMCGGL